ncbi:single-stranded DNA-binding protein [Leifsonia xyli subsp. xyli]|uniref:Single-strand DNA-binding protein n=2 Tax=Leifsonia xyli subsp. xyli TaxID=59736 RepID=Q6AES2_LEIXX|nr:single-stranded DNA-binding protein [Leifsonia xyli]AAT89123.1 single-strand DNA-binding protein [Leifsonia xyli subsp. xyli str. CTCB07]ODA89406.1 single-stranded DNA-binding protein [Leifsonia xyli subsp. xyli]
MTDNLAVRGIVATEPRHLTSEGGIPITSFRLVSTRRRFNRKTSSWKDRESNWYTVSAFRRLAVSAAACVAKGDPEVVCGRLSIREWMGEKHGVTVEIEADAIGHDLAWGRSVFSRTVVELSLDGGRAERASPSPEGIPVDSPGAGP